MLVPVHIELKNDWPTNESHSFLNDMIVVEDFLTVDEEELIIKEVDPYMKRLRYEFDHWDDVRASLFFSII